MNETCKMLFNLSEAFGGSGAENNAIDTVKPKEKAKVEKKGRNDNKKNSFKIN